MSYHSEHFLCESKGFFQIMIQVSSNGIISPAAVCV